MLDFFYTKKCNFDSIQNVWYHKLYFCHYAYCRGQDAFIVNVPDQLQGKLDTVPCRADVDKNIFSRIIIDTALNISCEPPP